MSVKEKEKNSLDAQIIEKIRQAVLDQFGKYGGSQVKFSQILGINKSVFNQLVKNHSLENKIPVQKWIEWAKKYGVGITVEKLKLVKTEVYMVIKQDIEYCKDLSATMICVGDVGIGKSYAAESCATNLENCFYVNCKNGKTKKEFIKLIAREVGSGTVGTIQEIKDRLKEYLHCLKKPVVILDDSGYLEYSAYLEMLELVDGTENVCGWYQIGDDSLQEKIDKGRNRNKVGLAAIRSRFAMATEPLIPALKEERQKFYKNMAMAILQANVKNEIVRDYLLQRLQQRGEYDMRNLRTLINLYNKYGVTVPGHGLILSEDE